MQEERPTIELARSRLRLRVSFCLFPFAFFLSIATAAHDTPVNPDDPAYLRRQYAWFQAQDPARQQQLRRLHADFQTLLPDEQARLTWVLQGYNAWLGRLPEADRRQVLAAPTAAHRLDEVKRLRERDWVESLPKVYRDEYARLDGDARRQKVQEWRAEEADRREQWAIAQRHWTENLPGRVPPVFANERLSIDAFVTRLKENLSEPERKALDDARTAADEFGHFLWYAFEIVRLSDQHPIFPWKTVGPRDFRELPDEARRQLPRPVEMPKEVRRAQGRWPEFAAEVTAYARKNNLKLPPLGDCRKDQMPDEVIKFLTKLEQDARKSDAARADLRALDEAQGKWPEYPRLVVELARKYKAPLPGWTLPGAQFWDRLRAGRKAR